MDLFPALKLGWLNGWILLAIEVGIQGSLLLAFPKPVVTRLFDRSSWSRKQKLLTVFGKIFVLFCLILIVFTPLNISSACFVVGLILYAAGVIGLVVAMFNFKDTPLGEPVEKGLYRISRHPQLVSLFIAFTGMCLAIGSWLALILLVISRIFEHFGILGEEEMCLKQYGEAYRAYFKRVPRYFMFF